MRVFTHEGRLTAPLDDVWEFHASVDAVTEIAPDWLGLEVEYVDGSQPFEEGTRIGMSVDPPGAPRMTWTSIITDVEKGSREARFVDRMRDGPFPSWTHTHTFRAGDDGTYMRDRIEYSLPWWMLGWIGEPFFGLALKLVFRHRLKKTEELVSGGRA